MCYGECVEVWGQLWKFHHRSPRDDAQIYRLITGSGTWLSCLASPILYFQKLFLFCYFVFGHFSCLCTTCVPGACGDQKRASCSLELELQTIVSYCMRACVHACVRSCVHAFIRVVRELYLGPLKEQLMLLNSELFFQPPPTFCFWDRVVCIM